MHTRSDMAQCELGPLCCKATLLADIHLLNHQIPRSFSAKLLPSELAPNLHWAVGSRTGHYSECGLISTECDDHISSSASNVSTNAVQYLIYLCCSSSMLLTYVQVVVHHDPGSFQQGWRALLIPACTELFGYIVLGQENLPREARLKRASFHAVEEKAQWASPYFSSS